jgi:hypothetical protein
MAWVALGAAYGATSPAATPLAPVWTIEPDSCPGYWFVKRDGEIVREGGKVLLFGSAAAASNWVDAR